MADLTNLKEDILLEEIFTRLSPQDSANLSQAHPVLGRVYRRGIMSELEGAETWEEFAAVVDDVLENHTGGALESLSISVRDDGAYQKEAVNTAVWRWIDRARRHRVSSLELQGSATKFNFIFITWEALKNLHLSWVHFPLHVLPPQFLVPNLYYLDLNLITIDPGTNLGSFLDACPNLREFLLRLCLGNGALTLNCPSLQKLDISGLLKWTLTIINLPLLIDFHVCSQELPLYHLLQHPISMAPITRLRQDAVSNVYRLFILVQGNLPNVIQFIQHFHHTLRHLLLSWFVPANIVYEFQNVQELKELDTVTIRGAPLYDEPLKVMVQYILAHSPSLSKLRLVVPRRPHFHVLEDDYLFKIERNIMELPRSSQQAKFEFSWSDN